MEEQIKATFTDFNISDEIRKNTPNWQEEFDFHRKYSYVDNKENKKKKGTNKRLTIDHFPEE